MPIKHNKKRSTGIVHETMVRRLGSQLIERDRDGATRSLELFERYFSPGQPMAEELLLFDAVKEARGCSRETSLRILDRLAEQARRMDARALDARKSALIRDVHHSFGRDFFDKYKIPDYRMLASVQVFADGARRGTISEGIQTIRVEQALATWMSTSPPPPAPVPPRGQVDELVFAVAARKFGERYGEALLKPQKSLLEQYVRSLLTGDMAPLKARLATDKKSVARALVKNYSLSEVKGDAVTRRRYVEAAQRLQTLDPASTGEVEVEEMMMFHRLVAELES